MLPLRRLAGTALAAAALSLAGMTASAPDAVAHEDPVPPTYWCYGALFDAEAGTVYGWVPCLGPANQTGPGWVRISATVLLWCDSVTYTNGGPLSPVRFVSGAGCRPAAAGEPTG
jgi:hypothetical protein